MMLILPATTSSSQVRTQLKPGQTPYNSGDMGDGHPLLGRRTPDLDLATPDGEVRVYTLLHAARPVLLDLEGRLDLGPWADRVIHVEAAYDRTWELPVVGLVDAPTAVLIRPDGHVAWVGDGSDDRLTEALTRWFGKVRAWVAEGDDVVAVTADRALRERIFGAGGDFLGPSWLLDQGRLTPSHRVRQSAVSDEAASPGGQHG